MGQEKVEVQDFEEPFQGQYLEVHCLGTLQALEGVHHLLGRHAEHLISFSHKHQHPKPVLK